MLDQIAGAVLSRYPALLWQGPLSPLGNHGGFSGARLWRVAGLSGMLCLRAWPEYDSAVRLDWRHRLMAAAREAGLRFVPTVFTAGDQSTWVEEAGRLWDLTEWLPGRADFHERPGRQRLEAAGRALALLHVAWEQFGEPVPGTCPAVGRRLACLREWHDLLRSGWYPLPLRGADPAWPVAERAWRLVGRWVEHLPGRLQPWAGSGYWLQPCLCDLWHDHLLFEGDHLTGLVDYGAVKVDHVAVDLGRMLGSLVEDSEEGWQAGLAAYRSVRPLSEKEERLARALDQTGTVLGVINWLRWLYEGKRTFESRAAAQRLRVLVERLERWESGSGVGWGFCRQRPPRLRHRP